MSEILLKLVIETWDILLDSAVYMLVGFGIAGVLKALVPDDWVARHLGKGDLKSVVKASLMGMPIPLCSCGVIPAAAGLRVQGASKGSTAAFLISTPETGVDSVAVTYALMDPLMTVIRPIAAFLTATAAGLGINWLDGQKTAAGHTAFAKDLTGGPACSSAGCSCNAMPEKQSVPLVGRLKQGIGFAYGDLLGDIGKWYLPGLLIAGAISVFVSPAFVSEYLGSGLLPMVLMLLVSVPFYVCATASTPIAAALVLKGLSPGAALIFLLAGPATNAASLTVIGGVLGKKAMGVYVSAIVLASLLLGVVTDRLYAWTAMDAGVWMAGTAHPVGNWIAVGSAVILLLLMIRAMWRAREHAD